MTKRMRLLAAFGLLAVVISVAAVAAIGTWGRDPIDIRLLDRILLGMTEEEVERVVGWPSGDYSGGRAASVVMTGPADGPRPEYTKRWADETAVLEVDFDVAGRVLTARLAAWGREGLIDRVRRRLGV